MSIKQRTIAIVDGYSTGRLIPTELTELGWSSVHVMSSCAPPDVLAPTYRPSSYSANIPYNKDLDTLVRTLRAFRPQYVVAGAECGVELADELGHSLGLPGNSITSSLARRNKFIMGETLRKSGLNAAEQHLYQGDDTKFLNWISHQKRPIVIKPVNSAGSDDVAVMSDEYEAIAKLKKILGKVNRLGLTNRSALAQSFVVGPQYVANSVSMHGKTEFTDIWEIHLRTLTTGAAITDYKLSVANDDPELNSLMQYTRSALDSLGIEFGAAHSEVRLTDKGPTLIETGARMMGATMIRGHFREVFGQSQAEFLAKCLVSGQLWRTDLKFRQKSAAIIHFNFGETGRLTSAPGLDVLEGSTLFRCFVNKPKIGQKVRRTENNGAKEGFCYLIGEDRNRLIDLLETYKELHNEGKFFIITPEGR